jgi:hypothetical protein
MDAPNRAEIERNQSNVVALVGVTIWMHFPPQRILVHHLAREPAILIPSLLARTSVEPTVRPNFVAISPLANPFSASRFNSASSSAVHGRLFWGIDY